MRFHSFPLLAVALLLLAIAAPPTTASALSSASLSSLTEAPGDVLFDETFRVRAGGELRLDLGNENVTVRTTRGDRARVTVEGRGRDTEREFERRRFSAQSSGSDLIVRTRPPRRWGRWSRTEASFQVTIEIPREYSVNLDTGSGDIRMASINGDARIDTGSGDVSLENVSGETILIDTGSGDVEANRLRGDVRIDTGSGDVEIGTVENGTVSVDTGSGDVDLALIATGRAVFDTGSGSVTLRLDDRDGFDVDLDGGSVRIDGDLDFAGRQERREARGRLGDGGASIRVGSGSGTIRLLAL
ncbi:MAG: DUF4097 family beta strand repeat-containing protein [Bacteroidota bacterium]